ncbi:PorT family protein [Antarcticibacterium arcticum]|uniref:PorT family protein n=1 Tax=Antarcticibacterium arcticum TaxID=2585771 RepID=A0A5B8YRJ0_9FLAO|nr:porin family protein [Antarcticibacterium arcticum]QED38729.1 PorT family protein [Antarcticibacterium arcticum]
MKKLCLILFGFVLCLPVIAQQRTAGTASVIDSLYREDQFYIGLTFHLLHDLPEEVTQKGFSGGVHLGFIRDFPINKRRNVAIGVGAGWSINTYGQELFIGEDDNEQTIFRDLNALDIEYDTNRFSTQLVEVPLEFRWRTSTPESYRFWRIYTGVRLGYIYHFKSNFRQEGNQVVQTDIPELERFRLGTTFTFGYNTFNFHLYYNLTPFFNNARLNDTEFGVHSFKVGLMFYLL